MDVIPRHGWAARPADTSHMRHRTRSARYVFYTHTAETGKCHVTAECCGQVRNIQYMHMNRQRKYIVVDRIVFCRYEIAGADSSQDKDEIVTVPD